MFILVLGHGWPADVEGMDLVLPESFLARPQINKSSDLCFVCFVVLLLV